VAAFADAACCGWATNNQDPDIKKILEFTFDLSRRRVNTSSELLRADNRPVPIGFTDEDIDLSAPALFSDTYCLYYVKNMIKIAINVLGMALTMSTRLDVIDFFQREIMATMELWNHTAKLLLEKGLMIRPPYIETMNEVRYVQNKDEFLGSIWGGARPLLSVEIEQLYFGIITNEVGKTLLTGFRQVTPSPELRDYMDKCSPPGSTADWGHYCVSNLSWLRCEVFLKKLFRFLLKLL
jgi:hypothetical protein